ncbi:MAG: B12-binding domain-containing radical SAM protein [Alphaproteobacteria bacterium]
MTKTAPKVFIADLTHTANGMTAQTFPLGASFVASYAKQELGDRFDFTLFRFPDKMVEKICEQGPVIIAFASYVWNAELSQQIAKWAKQRNPDIITVFGGPNFPVTLEEQEAYMKSRPFMDFYIQNEGEIGFVDLLDKLHNTGLALDAFKTSKTTAINCSYISSGKIVRGEFQRIKDLDRIPSPYTSGLMDEFFDLPLLPMVETTRGCPFSCAFCADGLESKNKIAKFSQERIRADLEYVSDHIKNISHLIITDLNFGMYKQDLDTARLIADIMKRKGWPITVSGSSGKNQPERVIEVASIMNGSWPIGSAVQSTDAEVLENVKRSNISLDAFQSFVDYVNKQTTDTESYTEIILGLPGDSLEKHFKSVATSIESGVRTVRIYQAIMLMGTEVASVPAREKFELKSKFRIIPGSAGVYDFDGDKVAVAELQEIVVQSKDMPFEDYVSCRKMNLITETFINKGMFEEVFAVVSSLGVPVFDVLLYMHAHDEHYPPSVAKIFDSFMHDTQHDLFDSHAEAAGVMESVEAMQEYFSRNMGRNELLEHRAFLYLEFAEISRLLTNCVKKVLADRYLLDPEIEKIFEDLNEFTVLKKRDIRDCEGVLEKSFDIDFTSIDWADTPINALKDQESNGECHLKFYHSDSQKTHIRNVTKMYEHHSVGLGKMLQDNILQKMYRTVERVT